MRRCYVTPVPQRCCGAGGRNWSLYGGDTYTELGGDTQKVGFSSGNYVNPGPWRIPYHHRTLLHYCKQFGVALDVPIEDR